MAIVDRSMYAPLRAQGKRTGSVCYIVEIGIRKNALLACVRGIASVRK